MANESRPATPVQPQTEPGGRTDADRPAITAYFETSAVSHIYRRQGRVTDETEARLLAAVRAGRLVIPASVPTTLELLGTIDSKDPTDTFRLGALYLQLASFERGCLKDIDDLVRDGIDAPESEAEPTPFEVLSRAGVAHWADILLGNVTRSEIRALVDDSRAKAALFRTLLDKQFRGGQEVLARHLAAGGQAPGPDDLWRSMALHYAEGFADLLGRGEASVRMGADGLLRRRRMLAAAGAASALVCFQVLLARHPGNGDLLDTRHVIAAAAAGGVLVTQDARLRQVVTLIPGLKLEALTVPEFVERL